MNVHQIVCFECAAGFTDVGVAVVEYGRIAPPDADTEWLCCVCRRPFPYPAGAVAYSVPKPSATEQA